MKIFIAGPSGVLGRATIRQLVARGHNVVGMVRSAEKARVVESLGAQAVLGDIFNATQVRELVGDAEAVLHLATAIPTKPRTQPSDWAMNDRLRREGTRNLLEACRGRAIRAYIQQSIAFLFGNLRGAWADETMSPRSNPILQSALDGEKMALDAQREWGLPTVVLRGAMFYDAESWNTRTILDQLRKRMMPIIGDGQYYWHYIHVEDMASAVVCATEQATNVAGEIFNVADDEPAFAKDILNYAAGAIGAPRPMRVPHWLARLVAGSSAVNFLTTSARYRTDNIKQRLGWAPRYPSYREGFTEIAARLR